MIRLGSDKNYIILQILVKQILISVNREPVKYYLAGFFRQGGTPPASYQKIIFPKKA